MKAKVYHNILTHYLFKDGLQTSLWAGLTWDFLQGLAISEGIDFHKFSQGERILRCEVIVQDLFYCLPVASFQGRVPEVSYHRQLKREIIIIWLWQWMQEVTPHPPNFYLFLLKLQFLTELGKFQNFSILK